MEFHTIENLGARRALTPEGFMVCYDVPVARVGDMIYGPGETPIDKKYGLDSAGRVVITRVADDVFASESLASLNGKPICDDHPPVDVTPANWKLYTKGTVLAPRRGTGDEIDYLLADFIIYDPDMIADIDAGKREVSCGYNPEYFPVLDEATGQPIPGRGRQRNILYNHMAVVPRGRCGPSCAVRDRDPAIIAPRTLDRAASALRRMRGVVVVNHFGRHRSR